jgi:hypothetical protein
MDSWGNAIKNGLKRSTLALSIFIWVNLNEGNMNIKFALHDILNERLLLLYYSKYERGASTEPLHVSVLFTETSPL